MLEPEMYTPAEAAAIIKVNYRTLMMWINKRVIPTDKGYYSKIINGRKPTYRMTQKFIRDFAAGVTFGR